jgi:plastocyanin
MMQNKVFTLLLFVLALTLVACGGSETSGQAPAEEVIVVDMNDIYYGESNDNAENPPVWQVNSGSEVTIRMENMGALEHNWAVLKAGEDIPVPFDEAEHEDKLLFSAGNVAAGAGNEVSFAAPEPGEYNVVCTVPGHAALMQGKLIVEA